MEQSKLNILLKEIAFLRHDPEHARTYAMIEAELNRTCDEPESCSSMELALTLPSDYPR